VTGRDRIVVMVLGVLAVLAAAWILVVSPEREKASKLDSQVSAAQAQLSAAEGSLASARSAQSQYAAAYASIVNLGKAVPASEEVPSLIFQLSQASNNKKVDFASIVATNGSGSSPSGTPAASAVAAGFTQMPFTFIFNGSYFDLEHLFSQLNQFTVRTSKGDLQVSGRLLTIQGVKLSPLASLSAEASKKGQSELTGTITATAYVLPASQGLTGGGATSASPGGAAPAASTSSTSGSPTTPAIVRVTP